jgi:hypothetical protein
MTITVLNIIHRPVFYLSVWIMSRIVIVILTNHPHKLIDLYRNCLRRCATVGRSRVKFSTKSLHFSIDLILPAELCPRGRLSL